MRYRRRDTPGARRGVAATGVAATGVPPTRVAARSDAANRFHQVRRRDLALAVRGGGECRHHAGDAERAGSGVALAPAFRDGVDDGAAAALLPVVFAEPTLVGAGGAAADDAGVERERRHQVHRGAGLAGERLAHQPAIGDRRRQRGYRYERAVADARLERVAGEQVALAAIEASVAATGVPAERRCRRLHPPRPAAIDEGLVAAEHAVEEARRIGAEQLAAQAVAGRHTVALHRRLLGREPARTHFGVGEEGRRHDRLDRRGRHRVVEDRRVEQRVGPVLHGVRQARIAGLVAAGPVDLLAGARRERAGERLDAAAGDVDHGDRRHPHHRAFEQRLAERLVLVFLAVQAERAAGVVAAGVAGGGLLRERLQGGVDAEVDRETDVDAGAVEDDAVGGRARFISGAGGCRLAGGLQPVQRAGRLAQRFERLQHRLQRRRHAPAAVVERIGEAGFTGEDGGDPTRLGTRRACARRAGESAQFGQATEAPLRTARRGQERTSLAIARRIAAEIDAAADAAPRVAPRHLARRDQHLLRGRPARERDPAFAAAPGQRFEHRRVAARERRQRVGEIGAAQAERPARRFAVLDRRRQRRCDGGEPAPGIETDRAIDARVGARAEGEQRRVEACHLRRDLLGRWRWRHARQAELGQPPAPGRSAAPFALARRQRGQHVAGARQRRGDLGPLQHCRLEGLQRRDQTNAHVALLRAAAGSVGVGRPDHRGQQHDAEQHRHHRDARGDREIEQRSGLAISHRAPVPAGRGG